MDNTKEVSKAIKRWLEDNGYSLAKVAEMFDSSPQSVSNSLSGDRFMGPNLAKKWAEAFGFNEVYLRTGEGQLISDNQPKKEKTDMEKAIEAIQSSNQITLKAQEQMDRLLSLLELQMGTKPWTVGEKEKGLRDGQK